MNTESNVGQPPTGTPGVPPPRRRQTTQSQMSNASFHERLKDARSVAVAILEDTTWPPRSQAAAQQLLQSINKSPYAQIVSDDNSDVPEDIREAVEQFIRVLKEVSTKLEKVASKYGVRKRGVRERVKYFLSMLRGGRCTQVLETCEDEVSKASTSVRNSIDQADQASAVSNNGTERGIRVAMGKKDHAAPSAKETHEAGAGCVDQPAAPQTSARAPTSQPRPDAKQPAAAPGNQPKGTGRRMALDAATKIFSTVETVSGVIPLVGQYIGAGAKVGLTCVEMAQVMYSNEDAAEELTSRTEKLSTLLQPFAQGSYEPEKEEATKLVQELQRQLQSVRGEIARLQLDGNFTKFVSSGGRSESLKEWDEKIRTTMNDIQLVINLQTADHVVDLYIKAARKEREDLRKEREELIDRLGDANYGARDSEIENVVCFPGTRVDILARINDWARGEDSEPVFWLRGMAGRGKSAIASTVAYGWREQNTSCAIFHFRRGQAALSARLICALARQLICNGTPEVKEAVLQAVRDNRDVATMTLENQFKILLVDSLCKLENNCPPVLLAIDALDECEDQEYAVRFINAIGRHALSFAARIRFLVTSRPEDNLVHALRQKNWQEGDLDETPSTTKDIAMFLQSGLLKIREEQRFQDDWPSEESVNCLAEFSQGLFQWAHTALKYIGEKMPKRRLRSLLDDAKRWTGLDDLYDQILCRAFDQPKKAEAEVQFIRRVLGIIVAAPYPVSLETLAYLCADYELLAHDKPDEIVEFLRWEILGDLTSMLVIPTSPADRIQFMHTSIRDLLIDHKRCAQKSYFIDVHRHHHSVAARCLRLMVDNLRMNICGLSDLSKSNSDPEVQNRIGQHVPGGLQYCCRAWSAHLEAGICAAQLDSELRQSLASNLKKFSEEKLLFWLEVMSLIGAGTEAIVISKQVVDLLQGMGQGTGWEAEELPIRIWSDSHRFISAFLEPIEFGALHIYMSALASCPTETMLYKHYKDKKLSQMKHGPQKSAWSALLWSRSISSATNSIAFSPDGKTLASGSSDGTIRLWDIAAGAPVGEPLKGHTSFVLSVAFSPDGKTLASGSSDETIRLWDVAAGVPVGEPLKGHTDWVRSVAFSPDGKTLASGSRDETIRLWDVAAGAPVGEPLKGHTSSVNSVVFSPDGKTLASGSDDQTIRLWDVAAGTPVGEPLKGHTSWVYSVAFSPDGKTLASGSDDQTIRLWDVAAGAPVGEPLKGHTSLTIRLWDVAAGAPVGEPLKGHTSSVNSVAFSPDGKTLASGSDDQTIRLWDVAAGVPVGEPLKGHTSSVNSVAFSPDGKTLASGSDDQTIRLWDVAAGAPVGEPLKGHTSSVNSVAFSPDGKTLASGSDDQTIRLWDVAAGAPVGEPLKGHTSWVHSVAFSPDGKTLASGSDDQTIRLWDIAAGTPVGEPLKGHTSWVHSVAFSPDGKTLASGSSDQTIRLWDIAAGTPVGEPLKGHTSWVYSVAFSPDGKTLASGSDDQTIRLWDVAAGAPVGEPLKGHTSWSPLLMSLKP
ncbi:hypothetical protein FRC00_010896 [Tulasnella sp. 408]|nr:hypothetical protein FRC00_010896 [Tulasnella sp. 408]